jgi:hypothetical protein
MTTIEKIFGLSTLILCSSVLLMTPWPDTDSLFNTHASPSLHESR